MRYLKIFESFSDAAVVQELWKVDPEDNIRLLMSCLDEAGLEGKVEYEILYAVHERVERPRSAGSPFSYSSVHFRSCYRQDSQVLRFDDTYREGGNVRAEVQRVLDRLRKFGPSKDFVPVIEVTITGLVEDSEPEGEAPEQVLDRIYTERFRDYFGKVYSVEECSWTRSDAYRIEMHMSL